MNWANIMLTSLSMSIDAMTVGAVDGLNEKNMRIRKMILIAFSFGLFQFVMPVIGYFIGQSFRQYVEKAIPWIAFGLLTLLALKSLYDFIKENKERKSQESSETEEKKLSIGGLLVQDVATSIDALCIGFVYMSYSVGDAMLVFGVIGITTFILSFITTYFGKIFASKLERWGSLIAAIVFFAVGLKILLEGIL